MKKLILFSILATLVTGQAFADLSPGLEAMLQGKSDDELVKVLVVLKDQPDIHALNKSLSSEKVSRAERHRTVVSTLKSAAAASNADLLSDLTARKSSGGVAGFTPHWLVNAIVIKATVSTIRLLALREDVERIEPDLEVVLTEPVNVKAAPGLNNKGTAGFLAPGLSAINAPRVWHELGIDGTGALVANLDSGVDLTHVALNSRWRGNYAPASACWQDGAEYGSPLAPVDYIGHGTHVMGTMTGVTAYDTVGVAPGAHWIASNAVASNFANFDNAVLAAFEWFADPDGNPDTFDDVPDVIQNSWGVSPGLGPYLECDSRWWDVLDNCEAAGVVLVWSAGNEGPAFGSLNSPGNRASTPTNSFSVGSTVTMPPYSISNFSSRGPSQCGGPFEIKPEVSAPGSDIVSTYPNNQYAYMSGTSMAGPHVAGVVALMRQANPDIEVDTVKEILMETALDLGNIGEDNTYGHGLIDAYLAVLTVLNDVGTVAGVVRDASTGLPVDGATIRNVTGYSAKLTEDDGYWEFTGRAGSQTFLAEKFGYIPTYLAVDVPAGGVASGDLDLPITPSATVSGIVLGPGGLPVDGATVTVQGVPVPPVVTDPTGMYSFLLPSYSVAAYDLIATAPGLAYDLRHTGLQGDTLLDFQLTNPNVDGFETGNFSVLAWQLGGDVLPTTDDSEAHEGTLSARAGAITHDQESELGLDYYANGPGEFAFWVMTESEPAYDALKFYLDGVLEGTWSGETPWTRWSTMLEPGSHQMRWIYSKDGNVSNLRDTAWIDLVSLPGTGVQPLPQVSLGTTVLEAQVSAGTIGPFDFELGNTGEYQLEYSADIAPVIAPPAGGPPWMTVSPDTGIVHPGSTVHLTLSFNGSAIPAGDHEGVLTITSSDPDHPDTTVAINLTVDPVSDAGDGLPQVLQLVGAVPNPFNPSTSIQFQLPASGDVSLKIYDVSGRLVRTVLATPLPEGRHQTRWDGKDSAGYEVASGVYYARLVFAEQIRIQPMTLIR